MSDVRNLAPFIDVLFYVTAEFGKYPSGGPHNGIDIATPNGSPLYSIVNGKVIEKGYQPNGYGYYIILKNNSSIGEAFLYGHLRESSPLNNGDEVTIGQYVGFEGTTGNSTGVHLHLGQENLGSSDSWIYGLTPEQMENPALYMGIDNIIGTTWFYDGEPYVPPKPPTPTTISNKKFNWSIFTKVIKKR